VSWMPCVVRTADGAGSELLQLGHPLVDDYLQFVAARARRNTLVAYAFDLKAFFLVVGKDPVEVSGADVLAFVQAQQAGGDSKVVRLSDGRSGVSAHTIQRRLSAVSGLYAYLCARGDAGVSANPVPKGLATRASRRGTRQTPLVRTPRTLPQVLAPAEVGALVAALRTHRDRAMVEAMLLGGLRRCEVLGLCLEDLKLGQRCVFVVDGKGGHQRLVPISSRFFSAAGAYLAQEPSTRCAHRPAIRGAQGR
jgi:integrase/recombinase XerD